MKTTIEQALAQFRDGMSRGDAVARALGRIADADGEGARTFLKVHAAEATALAQTYDRMERDGRELPPFAGVTVSIKDLFDIAGDTTTSGSVLLRTAPPATQDAVAVARLKAAGFVPVGRTNMTEFAFSGLGINPHYGTPLNPYDRARGRIPGGSSSGAAVSVSDGMATVALGTDTGGSCRIPAALCGLVGYKPTARRFPAEGAMPLSPTLDSIGSIGWSVACCAAVDAVLAGEPLPVLDHDTGDIRLGIPSTYVFDDIDDATAKAFDAAIARLTKAGVTVVPVETPELLDIPAINAKGGFAAREAFLFHRRWMETDPDRYDPRVLVRIRKGETQSEVDYQQLTDERRSLIARMAERTRDIDALVMPTVPLIAPALYELTEDAEYGRINLLMLRNSTVANMLDRCAISLPCHDRGQPPVGLMLMGEHMGDHRLLALAHRLERLLA